MFKDRQPIQAFPSQETYRSTASASRKTGTWHQKAAFILNGCLLKIPSAAALKSSLGSHSPVWHSIQHISHSTNNPHLSAVTPLHVGAGERLDTYVTWKCDCISLERCEFLAHNWARLCKIKFQLSNHKCRGEKEFFHEQEQKVREIGWSSGKKRKDIKSWGIFQLLLLIYYLPSAWTIIWYHSQSRAIEGILALGKG